MMHSRSFAALLAGVVIGAASPTGASEEPAWAGYLDYAYVYSSAEPAALQERLDGYAREAGTTLHDYVAEDLEGREARGEELSESDRRRKAIAHLLAYIASGDGAELARSVEAVNQLRHRLARHENRYWFHYIRAHRALEEGNSGAFAREVFDLWRKVVLVLEASYDTHDALSLSGSPNAAFVSALPYTYENVGRIVLLRSQQMGLTRGLDPLASIVRALHDGRIGSHPRVIRPDASSRQYLETIVSRLNGPESDGGSLTFTLALFEAGKLHDRARAGLSQDGLSEETQESIRVAIGAYKRALDRAKTLQGQVAVYSRVLRQLGELHAAKQRLGIDPDIDVPFSIDRAMKLYSALDEDRAEEWAQHGYQDHGRDAYLAAMRGLWEEIQEASFNASHYYLARGRRGDHIANGAIRDAVSSYADYLTLFEQHARAGDLEAVPDSAFLAAYSAARGVADAVLHFDGGNPSSRQLELSSARYVAALQIYPFDPTLWSALAFALEREGREDEYLNLVKPIADRVANSQHVDAWIGRAEPFADRIDAVRRAVSDDLALMYLGFADASDLGQLETGLVKLEGEHSVLAIEIAEFEARRNQLQAEREADLVDAPANLPPVSSAGPPPKKDIAELDDRLFELRASQERLEAQIEARSRALPLFAGALEAEAVVRDLATQRDHPVHALLRRMYFEN